MATSHFCRGKWRPGSVADCPRHKRLDSTQMTVYARSGESGADASSESDSSPSSDASSGSSSD